ncbi:TatD family hydrolase [Corynebacterium lizhenjunii]|uniref:TatD family hydrolase n=1 Tax=Corynebacterium lizhenjunii TaxID=2709394 RepID=A0A7T0PCK2_9CORY|nr:TatD family hydrolase [Corynebacterium lizhenjunii]QPK79817.1 TatD family hydrolase [Corynebacterium lizhenjunii]
MSKKKPRPTPVAVPGLSGLSDAHTHLYSHPDEDAALVARAAAAGVERMVTVGDDVAESQAALDAAHAHPGVWAACAVHPVRAHELDAAARESIARMAADPRCVAVGETGLDTYWIEHAPETTAPLEVQLEALDWHARLAKQVGKVLMIHNREADAQLLEALADVDVPVMLHCFSSPLAVAKEAVARGWVLSFAGNVTFKRNEELRQAAALVPVEQLLIETDAPYMTPEPFRGQRNEPALIGHTWQCIADARGVEVSDLAVAVGATFTRVFGLPQA